VRVVCLQSQPVEDMVDFGDNDFSDSAWDELRKTIEKIYKDINRTPARTRAAYEWLFPTMNTL